MAKLTGPLGSFTASGSIGDDLTYYNRHGRSIVRPYAATPAHTTDDAAAAHTAMADARAYWSAHLTHDHVRASYRYLARARHQKYPAYNAWIKQIIDRAPLPDPALTVTSVTINDSSQGILSLSEYPTGHATTDTSDVEVWTGPTLTNLTLSETVPIASSTITTAALDYTDTEKYLTLKQSETQITGIYDMNAVAQESPPQPADTTPIASVIWWPASTPPLGFLCCNGDAISRSTYDTLFSIIATTFGVGDGSTTFNLPDLIGRYAQGGTPDGLSNPGTTAAPAGITVDNAHANHTHGDTDNAATDHDHPSGTTALTGTTHTHSGLTYSQDENHTHTGTTGTQSASHDHGSTGSDGSHRHKVSLVSKGTRTSDDYIIAGYDDERVFIYTETTGNHTHTTGNQSADHTHNITTGDQSASHEHSFTTGSPSVSHSHTFNVDERTQSHAHGTSAANATHGHTLSGWDSKTAPDHLLLLPIIRALA